MQQKGKRSFVAPALFGSVLGLLGLGVPAMSAPDHACIAYQHRDFKGAAWGLAANGEARKSHIADKISAFKIRSGCYVHAFEKDDFQGPDKRWTGNVDYVGNNWNDLISSWKCVCSTGTQTKKSSTSPPPRPVRIDP